MCMSCPPKYVTLRAAQTTASLSGRCSGVGRERLLGPVSRHASVGGRGARGGLAGAGAVIGALDHAKIAVGAGGPAEMGPVSITLG